jgi:hypothetical protein
MPIACPHMASQDRVAPRAWLGCGHVGCCDSSLGKHATRHFHAICHPGMRSLERGESRAWRHTDRVGFELADPILR